MHYCSITQNYKLQIDNYFVTLCSKNLNLSKKQEDNI